MSAILTERHKAAIRLKLSTIPPEERANLIGVMRVSGDVPNEVLSFMEAAIVELRLAEERRNKILNEKPAAMRQIREMTQEEIRAFWKALGHLSLFILVIGGIVAVFVFVIIPALIAVGNALVIAAPYIMGAVVLILGGLSFIQSLRSQVDNGKPASEPEIIVRTTTITETFKQ